MEINIPFSLQRYFVVQPDDKGVGSTNERPPSEDFRSPKDEIAVRSKAVTQDNRALSWDFFRINPDPGQNGSCLGGEGRNQGMLLAL
ncbi:hypothetical protein [Pseudodesulfovibrio methanolicus]|uniref:Uncharacterized protein n=1 Tax=Pseudodesulfovibrio methanolicus TaxID=3126690 RepID=A0ABZ2J483_9BACT